MSAPIKHIQFNNLDSRFTPSIIQQWFVDQAIADVSVFYISNTTGLGYETAPTERRTIAVKIDAWQDTNFAFEILRLIRKEGRAIIEQGCLEGCDEPFELSACDAPDFTFNWVVISTPENPQDLPYAETKDSHNALLLFRYSANYPREIVEQLFAEIYNHPKADLFNYYYEVYRILNSLNAIATELKNVPR